MGKITLIIEFPLIGGRFYPSVLIPDFARRCQISYGCIISIVNDICLPAQLIPIDNIDPLDFSVF